MLSRFAAYSAVESKAFRLRVVFGPTGLIQRVHSAGEIGWALVTLLCLLSHGEVERHANSGAVFPL